MNSKINICPNCFAEFYGSVCRCCNTNLYEIKKYDSALEAFTVLKNRYLLGRVLGKGGFGITYLARDMSTGALCCIKEYMPSEFVVRDGDGRTLVTVDGNIKTIRVYEHGKSRFIDEAKTLILLKNNNTVVDITDFFEQNNTAYFVMEYIDGVSMKKYTSQYGGRLPCDIAKKIIVIVADALIDVHGKNMLHRDISPENILISKNFEVKLIDFGSARDYIKVQNSGMSVVLKAGYAPPEQYSTYGLQGPWTDIYSLAATFYRCVSGKKLLDSIFIMQGMKQPELYALNCGVDKSLSNVIEKAMKFDFILRYQNVMEFLSALVVVGKIQTNFIDMGRRKYFAASKRNMSVHNVPVIEFYGLGVRRKIRVPPDYVIRIGRSCDCDVVINDMSISRVHLFVTYDNCACKFRIKDKSANGSYLIDGSRLPKNMDIYVEPGTVVNLVNNNYIMVIVE